MFASPLGNSSIDGTRYVLRTSARDASHIEHTYQLVCEWPGGSGPSLFPVLQPPALPPHRSPSSTSPMDISSSTPIPLHPPSSYTLIPLQNQTRTKNPQKEEARRKYQRYRSTPGASRPQRNTIIDLFLANHCLCSAP